MKTMKTTAALLIAGLLFGETSASASADARRRRAAALEKRASRSSGRKAMKRWLRAARSYRRVYRQERQAADLDSALRCLLRAATAAPGRLAARALLERARLLLEHRRDKAEAFVALKALVRQYPRTRSARKSKRLLRLMRAFDPSRRERTARKVKDWNVTRTEDGVRVTLRLDGSLKRIPAPLAAAPVNHVRIKLPRFRAPKRLLVARRAAQPVRSIRLRRYRGSLLLDAHVEGQVEARLHRGGRDKLVVDLVPRSSRSPAARDTIAPILSPTPSPLRLSSTLRHVVIDPGHGGKDPGAVGRRLRLREKDLTLKIAKRVATLLRRVGIDATLTRSTDKTLPLKERTRLANRLGADLFLSIHVNSNPSRKRRGLEAYYLDTTRDRYAQRLAQRENRGETKVTALQYILADLHTKSNVRTSMRLAGEVLGATVEHLSGKYSGALSHGVKPALFYVLLGAKMPAILLETSYLSNDKDENLLSQDAYAQRIAEGIFLGVRRFALRRTDLLAAVRGTAR